MESIKPAQKIYVVLQGRLDDVHGENVEVIGTFLKEEDAYEFRNAEYKESNSIDDEDEGMGPDLNSHYVDDGYTFWMVQDSELK